MKRIIFLLIFISAVSALYALKSYTVMSRGIVRDNSTGLYWTRCPLTNGDVPIYDFQCDGSKKLYTWAEAVEACNKLVHEGRSDWRLPSVKELESIVFHYHYVTGELNYSQVVESVFPNAVTLVEIASDYYEGTFLGVPYEAYCDTAKDGNCYEHYWSSTSLNAGAVLVVNFYSGGTQWDAKTYTDSETSETKYKYKSVRCVAGP